MTSAVLFVLLLTIVGNERRCAAADRQARALATVARKLDLVMAHLGVAEPEPDVPARVLEELSAGRRIQAIKEYREATGASLRDAKDAVDDLARQHGLL